MAVITPVGPVQQRTPLLRSSATPAALFPFPRVCNRKRAADFHQCPAKDTDDYSGVGGFPVTEEEMKLMDDVVLGAAASGLAVGISRVTFHISQTIVMAQRLDNLRKKLANDEMAGMVEIAVAIKRGLISWQSAATLLINVSPETSCALRDKAARMEDEQAVVEVTRTASVQQHHSQSATHVTSTADSSQGRLCLNKQAFDAVGGVGWFITLQLSSWILTFLGIQLLVRRFLLPERNKE